MRRGLPNPRSSPWMRRSWASSRRCRTAAGKHLGVGSRRDLLGHRRHRVRSTAARTRVAADTHPDRVVPGNPVVGPVGSRAVGPVGSRVAVPGSPVVGPVGSRVAVPGSPAADLAGTRAAGPVGSPAADPGSPVAAPAAVAVGSRAAVGSRRVAAGRPVEVRWMRCRDRPGRAEPRRLANRQEGETPRGVVGTLRTSWWLRTHLPVREVRASSTTNGIPDAAGSGSDTLRSLAYSQ
jgi:hypothetical protein